MPFLNQRAALILFLSIGLSFGVQLKAQKAQHLNTYIGAGKVDVTPSKDQLTDQFFDIYDNIYARSIIVSNANDTIALVTVDVGGFNNQLAESILQRIADQTGIPTEHIMLTATHTHSVPFGIHGEEFESKIASAVSLALQNLQPGKIGFGTGVSFINVNRNIIDPNTRRWTEGPNYEGHSDKTVGVITFENLKGEPIAVYYNYAMHAVISGMFDMICSDVPGATSRYIEENFDNKIIAVWSTGACGDQNPLYYQQTYDLRALRIKEFAERGIDISNSMPPGGYGLDREDPQVIKLMDQQKQMLQSMGQFLGEEVLHVMRNTERKSSQNEIFIGRKTITCPGRKRLDQGRAGYPGVYEDADSIDIKLGLITLGNIALTSVNGEVFSPIATRLKNASPYGNTLMLTLTNGYAKSGYIPNDAAFGTYTFEVLSSKLKPGFAENAIIKGLLDLMELSFHKH